MCFCNYQPLPLFTPCFNTFPMFGFGYGSPCTHSCFAPADSSAVWGACAGGLLGLSLFAICHGIANRHARKS